MIIAGNLFVTKQMISTLIKEKFYFEWDFILTVLLTITAYKMVLKI